MAKKTILSKRSRSYSTPWFESSGTKGLRFKLSTTVTDTITHNEKSEEASA